MTDGVAARFTTEVGSDQSATNIRRLQPLRVLLSGQDRRFIAPAVVMVTDDGKNLWSGQPTVEKWTPLEQLVGAIESASLTRRLPAAEAASQ